MAKELAFQQIKRNGCTIQLYERASTPRAQIVNRTGDQLLACTGFSLDKNSRIRRGDLLDLFERSEEHTSELQSHLNLVCRLLLEKKNLLPSRATKSNTQSS